MPNDNLQQALVKAAENTLASYPELTQADLTAAYTTYRNHFATETEQEPPVSYRPAMDELLLSLWDVIVDRETSGLDQTDGKLEDHYARVFGSLLKGSGPLEFDDSPIAIAEAVEAPVTPAPVVAADKEEAGAPIDEEATDLIYRIKISLDGSQPLIWRSVLVPAGMPQTELHHLIQSAMGWRGTESFQFLPQQARELPTAGEPLLHDLLREAGDECGYEFDRAGSWYHNISLEGIELPEGRRQYPVCIGGQRACPPEDAGGIREYEEMLEALQDPSHPDYREMAGWLTEGFNPATFNIDQANLRLARHGRVSFEAAR